LQAIHPLGTKHPISAGFNWQKVGTLSKGVWQVHYIVEELRIKLVPASLERESRLEHCQSSISSAGFNWQTIGRLANSPKESGKSNYELRHKYHSLYQLQIAKYQEADTQVNSARPLIG
jgi:hypothetical protein